MNAGRELDALVAEKVMGWSGIDKKWDYETNESFLGGKTPDWDGRQFYEVPHYSTDIAAAWLVVEKLRTPNWEFQLDHTRFMIWHCRIETTAGEGSASSDSSQGETAPLAICLAALKAVGHAPQD